MRKIFLALLLLGCSLTMAAGSKHTFAIANGSFLYDGKPIQIHSGEMHYSRIPAPYWRHRLRMMKAMGLNCVATYVFWNHHELAPGKWDWQTDNRNLRQFLTTAQQEGMMVILRPGPYGCGEWEFGGYPWWLQKAEGMVIRSYNRAFLDSCSTYIHQLTDQMRDLQVTHGGPVIMVQCENEFGSYVAQTRTFPWPSTSATARPSMTCFTRLASTCPSSPATATGSSKRAPSRASSPRPTARRM